MNLNYLILPTTDAEWNLACEQYVFESLPRDRSWLLLWQNRSAVVIGRFQNALAEVNAEFLRERDIQLVRRCTGGGAVYHDLGNLNYSLIADADASGRLDIAAFCRPVLQTLRALGVPAELSGRNDMTVDGKKFSGNAQSVRNGRVLHHGTLLFDSDLEVVSRALHADAEKLQSKGVASVRSRVTNLRPYLHAGMDVGAFRDLLLESFLKDTPGEPYALTEDDRRAIEAIKARRYACWDWNIGRSPAGRMEKKRRFEGCGAVTAYLSTEGGRITELSFHGDFFSESDPQSLADRLIGAKLSEEALAPLLPPDEVARCFSGLRSEQLMELLLY